MVIKGRYRAFFWHFSTYFGIYTLVYRTIFSQICPSKCPFNEYISFYESGILSV